MSDNPLPRKGSIVYGIQSDDAEVKKRTLRKWKWLNKYLVVPLARLRLLPLLGLKNTFVVISVVGRKSGKRRRAGLQLRKVEDKLFIFLARGERTQWYKNHLANPDKTRLYYGFKKRTCDLRKLDFEEKITVMRKYVQLHPRWSNIGIGWKEEDDPHGGLIRDYVTTIEIMEILLKD